MSRKQQGAAPAWKAKKKEKAKTSADKVVTTQQTPAPKPAPLPPSEPPPHEWPAAQQSYARKGPYAFLNPYNFVRYLPPPNVDANQPATVLLGRCSPPPHDRYVGLSGTIHCHLEVVTPLFIADSEDIRVTNYRDEEGEPKEHLHYRFFQVAGQDVIPATSLRGAIRSLFEAVTNSCFSVFDGERILEYRADPSEGNKLKQNGGFVTKLATPQENGEIILCHVGTVAFYVEPTEKNRTEKKQNAIGVEREQWQNGEYIAARARQRKKGGWKIIEIARHLDELEECQPDKDGQVLEKHVEGWLYITGKGEETNKVNETFILDPQKHGNRGTISFGYAVQTEYNRIRQGQFERDELPVSLSTPRLTENEFVWIGIEGEGRQRIVKRLARVQVPRLPYPKAIGELLPPHLHPCQTYDALCPACRVFGWVKDAHLAGARHWSREERSAYAGRVRFSHAILVDGKDAGCFEGEIPLAILGSPRPTSVPFYLAKGDPNSPTFDLTEGDRQAGYTSGYKLRGRKF